MQQLIRQLEKVRGRARLMLLVMRTAAWVSGILAAAVAAGAADYALRLPGWLRLILLAAGVGYALAWATGRIGRWLRVRPPLTLLAGRLERMYPSTAGHLASAVAFSTEPGDEGQSPVGRELASQARSEAEGILASGEVRRLLDPTLTLRWAAVLAVAVAGFCGLAAAAPQSVAIAFQRWAMPLGDAKWPNRYRIVSMTEREVAPNNAPLRLAARVVKGDRPGLRAWAIYRFVHDSDRGRAGEPPQWQRALMTRQSGDGAGQGSGGGTSGGGEYQRLLEPQSGAEAVELYFEAGDDRTDPQRVTLIRPPTLSYLVAEVEPPAYAAEFERRGHHDLLEPPRPVATVDAREGARVRVRVWVDGSYRAPTAESRQELRRWMRQTMVGLLEGLEEGAVERMDLSYDVERTPEAAFGFTVGWTLHEPVEFRFRFTDEYGSQYEDQRLFRFEPRSDRPPTVAILEPPGDQSVLATATVPLAAEAQDDVAVQRVWLESRGAGAEPAMLAEERTVRPSSRLSSELDLRPLELAPGDELSVVAVAEDNYLLEGATHGPVESTPRRLFIISPEQLVGQVRTELAEVRQQALRARQTQDRLIEAEADREATRRQRDVAERLGSMNRSVEDIGRRVRQNRLEDEWIERTIEQSRRLTASAQQSAQRAAGRLDQAARADETDEADRQQARQEARQQQERVSEQLERLVQLLDQGRDAYELKQRVVKLSREQEELSERTRQTLPRTLGRSRDQLDQQAQRDLEEMSQQQREMAEEARQLAERMRGTSEAISRQSQRPEDLATAEALERAASTATREALDEKMREASEQVDENRLAQAQQQQQAAQQVLRQMLEQLGRTDQIRQEILRRKLLELVESIRQLRDQQRAQLDRLRAAELLDDLDAPLLTLRRNTLAVAEQARGIDEQTAEVAELLEAAAGFQGEAVRQLRSPGVSKPNVEAAEGEALTKLNEALALAEELARKAQNQMTDQERQKLIAAYRRVLAEQEALMEQTRALAAVAEAQRDRRWRAEGRDAGNRQADVRIALHELGEQVDETIVYRSVHDDLDAWASAAAAGLRRGRPDAAVVLKQRMIIATVEALIEALQPERPDEQFATGDSGGGGGGQGGPQPLIPPAAEVKLLRARQVQVHAITREVAESDEDAAEMEQQIIEELARQQQNLAETGRRLIEALQQQQRGVLPVDTPEPQP